eukprot:4328509-Amphidinium_carterae.2
MTILQDRKFVPCSESLTPPEKCQFELNKAQTVIAKFKLSEAEVKLDEVKKDMGSVAVLVLEARLLSVVQSKQLTVQIKRQKLQDLCKKIGTWGKDFGLDIKRAVHPKIMVEGVNKLLHEG